MTDELKQLLNILQNHIVSENDYVLLIFDNKAELLKYKRKNKYICTNQLLVTINDLIYSNFLDGTRFKRYHFVLSEKGDK